MKKIFQLSIVTTFIMLLFSYNSFSQGTCPNWASIGIGGWQVNKNGCIGGPNTIDLCSVNGQIKKVPVTFCVDGNPVAFPAQITVMQRTGTGPFTWTTRPDMPPFTLAGVGANGCVTVCVPIGEGTFGFKCIFGYNSQYPCDAYDFTQTQPECAFHVIYHSPGPPPATCLPDLCNP